MSKEAVKPLSFDPDRYLAGNPTLVLLGREVSPKFLFWQWQSPVDIRDFTDDSQVRIQFDQLRQRLGSPNGGFFTILNRLNSDVVLVAEFTDGGLGLKTSRSIRIEGENQQQITIDLLKKMVRGGVPDGYYLFSLNIQSSSGVDVQISSDLVCGYRNFQPRILGQAPTIAVAGRPSPGQVKAARRPIEPTVVRK